MINGPTVGKLVLARVQSPSLVTEIKLIGKTDAKCFKISGAGYLVTEVKLELHLFNRDD